MRPSGPSSPPRAIVRRLDPLAHRDWEKWERLAKLGLTAQQVGAEADTAQSVDVVVPVYRGLDETLACLHSAITSSSHSPFRLIVINDASPEPELVTALERLAGLGLIMLSTNVENLGFVRTVNAGMALSRHRDVVLLNADAIVYNDWLDRLRWHARKDGVASVTPLSNNATLASYPQRDVDNRAALELDPATLDAGAAEANARLGVKAPTGVGFCFYMTRSAIETVGLFDHETFGRGYGEENDWCRRADERGLNNLIAADVFVTHKGGVSFSEAITAAQQRAGERLSFLHPSYNRAVADFARADPLAPARAALDLWRVRRQSAGKGVLMILHSWGGGVLRAVDADRALLQQNGVFSLIATSDLDGRRLRLEAPALAMPNLPALDLGEPHQSAERLKKLNLGRVEIHSLVGVDTALFEGLEQLLHAAGLPWSFVVHDYAVLCPRINMVDLSGGYCETPSASYCQKCLDNEGSPFGSPDIHQWRERYGALIRGASEVRVPHPDVKERLARFLPGLKNVSVRRHPYLNAPSHLTMHALPKPALDRRRIAVIGGLNVHKGSHVLLGLAADAWLRQLPASFHLLGFSDMDDRLSGLPNLTISGKFEEDQIDAMVAEAGCDVVLFPSVCPETFCFTLDIALRNGVYPVAFDLGALGARIREVGFGELLPRAWMFEPQLVNDRLMALTPTPPSAWPILEASRALPPAVLA